MKEKSLSGGKSSRGMEAALPTGGVPKPKQEPFALQLGSEMGISYGKCLFTLLERPQFHF